MNRYLLGNNELIIGSENDEHYVKESHMNYEIVFSGELKTCEEYCKRREDGYLASIIG